MLQLFPPFARGTSRNDARLGARERAAQPAIGVEALQCAASLVAGVAELRGVRASPEIGDTRVLLHGQVTLTQPLGESRPLQRAGGTQQVRGVLRLKQLQRALRVPTRYESRVVELIERDRDDAIRECL